MDVPQQHSIRIPISESSDYVEIFPDELPHDVNSLLDVLRAEYAPLKIWRIAAIEYYRQQQYEYFSEVLNEISSSMQPEIIEYYQERGEYKDGIVEIYDALAAYSLFQSFSLVDDPLGNNSNNPEVNQKIEQIKNYVVEQIGKAEKINPTNDYTLVIRGFYEVSYGNIDLAEYYLKNVYDRSIKLKNEKRFFLYVSTLGLGAVAYGKKKYTTALDFFVKAMNLNPVGCGTNVRIAIAVCCFKLEQYERARLGR